MRILVVGGGGREHALCWAISASSLCENLYCAPGNAGISKIAECIDIQANNIKESKKEEAKAINVKITKTTRRSILSER